MARQLDPPGEHGGVGERAAGHGQKGPPGRRGRRPVRRRAGPRLGPCWPGDGPGSRRRGRSPPSSLPSPSSSAAWSASRSAAPRPRPRSNGARSRRPPATKGSRSVGPHPRRAARRPRGRRRSPGERPSRRAHWRPQRGARSLWRSTPAPEYASTQVRSSSRSVSYRSTLKCGGYLRATVDSHGERTRACQAERGGRIGHFGAERVD